MTKTIKTDPANDPQNTASFDAWNPGLESTIPHRLSDQITLFHADNSWVNYKDAQELKQM